MTVLDQIAFNKGRRDEAPNQQLARALARTRNASGIREIARNLRNPNRNIQSDCLKVLYEIGYLDPVLIARYADEFLTLLANKNNGLVWGSMIALGTIAPLRAKKIWSRLDEVLAALDHGSVITVVWGVRTLGAVAAANRRYRAEIVPHLLRQLETCLPRDVSTHAHGCLPAIDDATRRRFLVVLERRRPDLSSSSGNPPAEGDPPDPRDGGGARPNEQSAPGSPPGEQMKAGSQARSGEQREGIPAPHRALRA